MPNNNYSRLVEIGKHATTIFERLQTLSNAANSIDSEPTNTRLTRWVEVVGKGDSNLLEKRLSWDGYNLTSVKSVLDTEKAELNQTADWLKTFSEVISLAQTYSNHLDLKSDLFFNHDEPIAFEEIFVPFVRFAHQQFIERIRTHTHLFSSKVVEILFTHLLNLLVDVSLPTLTKNFVDYRMKKKPGLFLAASPQNAVVSDDLYTQFIDDLYQDHLNGFFERYPVLARLLSIVTEEWLNSSVELLHRLAADWNDLCEMFNDGHDLGQVTDIEPNLSDPHHSGRRVVALTFADGLKLIYKPKDMGLEAGYNQFLAWVNDCHPSHPFKVCKVLNRGAYGWVEFIGHDECNNLNEVSQYYFNAGALLCVIYVLEGVDCHFENIVAHGAYPVLIDTETLFQYRFTINDGDTAEADAQEQLERQISRSVLRTGFLPQWYVLPNGASYDYSALGHITYQAPYMKVKYWENINTDWMKPGYKVIEASVGPSSPLLAGRPVPPNDYIDRIIAGFRETYDVLMTHQAELIAESSPLAILKNQKVRLIFRGTRIYAGMKNNLLQPNILRDGADFSIELDLLTRAFMFSDEQPTFWHVLKQEQQQLQQMDIPFFVANSSSTSLILEDGSVIENCFAETSYNVVKRNIAKLNTNDLQQQIQLITKSFYTHIAHNNQDTEIEADTEDRLVANTSLLSDDELVSRAEVIAHELRQQALIADDGSMSWIVMRYVSQANRYQLWIIDNGIYDGCSGIAIFFAALAKVTGKPVYKEFAHSSVQRLRRSLRDQKLLSRLPELYNIGAAGGLGSLVYSLTKLSELLNEPDFLEDAMIAALQINEKRIASDKAYDVILGSAGAILGLLALYRHTHDPRILERASLCAEHLLTSREMNPFGFQTWPTLNQQFLAGFSHGAAGVAYALLQLYKHKADERYLEAAQSAISFEDTVFSDEMGNWPDFRVGLDHPGFMASWCHGAPGIGLTRLGISDVLSTPQIEHDIQAAIKKAEDHTIIDIDHICCGNFSRVELLLNAAVQLSKPELKEAARRKASQIVAKSDQNGAYHLFSALPIGVYNPAFFKGTAGIGYELLRLVYPEQLPSILSFE